MAGIVTSFHGRPIPVPVLGVDGPKALVEAVRSRLTPRSVALYFSTPNNPTGQVLPRSWMEALATLAREEGLWLLSDEVYEDYAYARPHTHARPLAPECTFSVHSFSKAYGTAGNRCGYVVGPAQAMAQLRKVSTHSFYSTPTASQLAALRALAGPGEAWAAAAAAQYREVGARAAERIGLAPPEGGTFLFVDAGPFLREDGLEGLLERCVERGLLVAPGTGFGPYPNHVRLCFTCAPPEQVLRGVEVLAGVLGR
jgi:aspartate/methionine/tyrosine aminotransferase